MGDGATFTACRLPFLDNTITTAHKDTGHTTERPKDRKKDIEIQPQSVTPFAIST